MQKEAMQIMGILNCTPDSFSDGAELSTEQRVARAIEMIEQGADIIDIGGESTRPGAQPVSEEEELARVVPVIIELRKQSDIRISVDTSKSEVAKAALTEGADIINDITALRSSEKMSEVIAEHEAEVVLMHMQGSPENMQVKPEYKNAPLEVEDFLLARAKYAESCGIKRDRIILDPGFGFGKTFEHNAQLFMSLKNLRSHGYQVLVGVSRKSMISDALGLNIDQRLEASLAMAVMAAEMGCEIIRVHDVKETYRAVRMCEKLEEYR